VDERSLFGELLAEIAGGTPYGIEIVGYFLFLVHDY
jgi:hypothetical protein